MKNKIISIITILTLTFGLVGCTAKQQEEQKREASFLTLFDTVTTVVGYAKSDDEFKSNVQLLHDELLTYHELYDIYNDYNGINNIKTINDNAGIKPVKVDSKIIELLLFSKEAYTLTNGKVNIAMGSVLAIWHEYRSIGLDEPQNASLPESDQLSQASRHTNLDRLIIDENESTVFLDDANMSLDVGAIAKGFAVQRLCDFAKEQGLDRFLLSVGGNVSSIGAKTGNGDPWVVGIQSPYKKEEYAHTVYAKDISVVTSGNYQRYYTVDGVQYHHIIDPNTLMPANYFDAVTILCSDSGLADVLSTAIYLMPFEQGKSLIESVENAEAIWTVDEATEVFSSGFESYMKA